ncbi:MAG: DUF429 domain-containing protein [bacterium]|nr:DUF429 domain-containing protein [bacterium]
MHQGALGSKGIEIPDYLEDGGSVPADDLLDATAAAWSAWRVVQGTAGILPHSLNGAETTRREVIWY